MNSRSFSSEESATTPAAGGRAGFFNFRDVVLVAPPRAAQDHAARAMEPWAWRDIGGAGSPQGQATALSMQPGWLKKRHLLWFLLVLVLMHLSQLMAKNDDQRGSWTPPIEPPGSVIVTSLSEGSPSQRSASRASDTPQRQATPVSAPPAPAAAITATRQQPPQASGSEAALRQAIQQWSQAWSGQNMAPYLGMYASDFEPPKGLSRTNWVKQRTQRITSKKSIRHEIQNLTVQINANLATVRFTQIYQDERLRASDRKTMHWVWRQGQWQITRETTD
ncbi:nuclear transport factor 2 family protein [Limnohabitans sp.]|uniref:nuclear transport factor 2 family protein n=2 Tax=Limnohabitans sp. TaxID=1907725 RepID=UPI0025C3F114|nr:nuclear transport factor 2 family protein [Limnohabitans sp.]